MKKIAALVLFIYCLNGMSQHLVAKKIQEANNSKTSFKKYSIFTLNPNTDDDAKNIVKKATYANLELSSSNDIIINQPKYLELEIPYANQTIVIQLYKIELFAENFHVDSDVTKNIAYQKGLYYRGIIKNDYKSIVSFNFFKNECNGIISSNLLDNLVVGKLLKSNNIFEYIIYKDSDLKVLNNFKCNAKELNSQTLVKPTNKQLNPQSNRCVTFYFEIDHDLYIQNNSNLTTTTNWMTSVFNNVQTLFNNDGITVGLKSLFIWQNPDIYTTFNFNQSADYLYKFHEIRPVFDGDLGQLVSIDNGGLGGVAVTINGLCGNNNFSYSDVNFQYATVPTYSWTVLVITHEFGHLMGSPHTHACLWNGNNTAIDGCALQASNSFAEGTCDPGPIPSDEEKGTIMSYCHLVGGVGISFNNGFGPQPSAKILSSINEGSCLSTDCINTCINKILTTTVSAISSTSATINWTEQGGSQTSEVAIYPLTSAVGPFVSPTANSFTANNLLPNTYYKAIVRKICSAGLIGPEIAQIFVTDGDYCSGITLTDSGGATNDYINFENVTRIIIPANPFSKAKITFSAFDLELDYDYLQIFNGRSTSFTEISGLPFGYSGNILPPTFESTASDGALTLKFTADGGLVKPGYIATVSCNTLGNNFFEQPIDFSYTPNPTNGLVNIVSKTEISEIALYNIAGQLLFFDSLKNLNAKIDLSAFAAGTYFVKMKFNEREFNFKIFKL